MKISLILGLVIILVMGGALFLSQRRLAQLGQHSAGPTTQQVVISPEPTASLTEVTDEIGMHDVDN